MHRATKLKSVCSLNQFAHKSNLLSNQWCKNFQNRSFNSQRDRELLNLPLTDVRLTSLFFSNLKVVNWLETKKTTSEEIVKASINHYRNLDQQLNALLYPFKNTSDSEGNINQILGQARQSDIKRKGDMKHTPNLHCRK
jgi:hypothetical protein